MSHYPVLVMVTPEELEEKGILSVVKERLAPFDENLQVEPYEEKCWCVSLEVRNYAV